MYKVFSSLYSGYRLAVRVSPPTAKVLSTTLNPCLLYLSAIQTTVTVEDPFGAVNGKESRNPISLLGLFLRHGPQTSQR